MSVLKKIWTSQYARFARAAYAEAKDRSIDGIVADVDFIMQKPGARFYKVEIKDNGAFIGYFIIQGFDLVKYHIRPHFSIYEKDLLQLAQEARESDSFAASLDSSNVIINV